MKREFGTAAEIAIAAHRDGRIELAADVDSGNTRREFATENAAAGRAAAITEAAIRAAALQMRSGTVDAIVITVQTRRRELTMEELTKKLKNVH